MITSSSIFCNCLVLINHVPVQEPSNVSDVLADRKRKSAMMEKLHALHQNNTWELVPSTPNMPLIDNRWVFMVKFKPDGLVSRFKTRLVAKGFQQTQGIDCFETFNPVIKQHAVRVTSTLQLLKAGIFSKSTLITRF